MSANLGSATVYIDADTSKFTSNLNKAKQEMQNFSNETSSAMQNMQSAGKDFESVGKSMMGAGKTLTKTVTAPIIGIGAVSVKTAAEFEQSMDKAFAIGGEKWAGSMDQLTEKAREMGRSTIYTASESAEAFQYMALAGWDVEQSIAAIDPVLKLAGAAGMGLGRTSDIVTDSMTQFGLSAEGTTKVIGKDGLVKEVSNAQMFTDVLAQTMRSANTDVDQMGEAFKYIGPLAGQMGYSIQDVSLALGTMANAGIKSTQAGTSLRRMIQNMGADNEQTAKAMDILGISMYNVDGSAKPLRDVLNDLRSSLSSGKGDTKGFQEGMAELSKAFDEGSISEEEYNKRAGELIEKTGVVTDKQKLMALEAIGGATAMAGLASIIGASDEDWNNLAGAIDGANGSVEEMYSIMQDNLSGQLTVLKSALSDIGITIGNDLMPYVKELVDKFQEWADKFANMDEGQRLFIEKIALAAAAAGPLIIALGALSKGFGSMLQLPGQVANGINTLHSGFSKLHTGVLNVGEAFKLQRAGMSGFAGETSKLGAALGGVTGPMVAVAALIAVLVAAFVTLWKTNEDFRNKIIGIWDGIKSKFEEAGQKITDALNSLGFNFGSIVDVLKTVWFGFCDLLAPYFEGVFTYVGTIISGVVDIFTGIIEIIIGIVKGFKDGDWSTLWNGVKDVVTGAIELLLAPINGIGEAIFGMVETVAGWLGADWTLTWEDAKTAVVDFVNGIIEWFTGLPGKIGMYIDAFEAKIIAIKNNVVKWFQELPAKLGEIWNNIVTGVQNFVTNAITFFQELPYKIGFFIGEIIGTVATFVVDMVSKAIELGSEFVSNVVEFFQELPGKIKEFVTNIWNNIKQWASDMKSKAKETGTEFLNNIVNFFKQLPDKVRSFITSTLNAIISWAADMIRQAKETGQNFLDNIVTFFKELPVKVKEFVTNAWNTTKQWATDMINKAKETGTNFLNNIVNFFKELPTKVREFITHTLNAIVSWAADMIKKAKETGQNFLDNIVNFVKELPGKVKEFLNNVITNVQTFATNFAQKATDAAKNFFNNIVNKVREIPGQMLSIGGDIVRGIWNGISGAAGWLANQISGFAKGIVDGIKSKFKIKSPSRVMADEIGKFLPPGIVMGFEKAMPKATKEINKSLGGMVDNFNLNVILEDFTDTFINAFKDIIDQLKELIMLENSISFGEGIGLGLSGDGTALLMRDGGQQHVTTTVNNYYEFTTDRPIDELEAAKQLRKTQRDVSEGFV